MATTKLVSTAVHSRLEKAIVATQHKQSTHDARILKVILLWN
jgi:hypothetical protein